MLCSVCNITNMYETRWRLKIPICVYCRQEINKNKVYNHYSNGTMECKCCGEKEIIFLNIYHINNNGAEERRKLKKGGHVFYKWLVDNNFPVGYQIFRRNCNWGKYINNGICPHEKK